MRAILFLMIFIFATPLLARTETMAKIVNIDMGLLNDEPLFYLSTGQVVSYPQIKANTLTELQDAVVGKKWFNISLNEKREITSLLNIKAPIETSHQKNLNFSFAPQESFTPSILKDIEQAKLYFQEARKDAKRVSQCFNRAHIWSYEWRVKKDFYSSKAWLFFTPQYIRKYKFEWWFHVAPMIHVGIDGEAKERVMDIKHSKGPLSIKQWTDIFMRDSANCLVVENYTDYADYPESGSCFVMKSSMYYYQPVDLEIKEIQGIEKNRWLPTDVKQAYLEAFDIVL